MTAPVALALSPHLDDAAFSCGGTLAMLAARGWRVVVATLFTASVPEPTGFALACQTDKGLGPEVDYMALRREEDAAACRALGAEAVWLPFPEAPHRRYTSAAELFGPLRADDEIGPALSASLETLMTHLEPTLLLAPQAIGGHVDHVHTVRALTAVSPTPAAAWWRDFPYTARAGSPVQPFREIMFDKPLVEIELDAGEMACRERACLAYTSQIGFQFGGPAGLRRMLAAAGTVESFAADGAIVEALAGIESVAADEF